MKRRISATLAKERILLIGPPGSGKGTIGELLEKALGLPCLSGGEVVRSEIERKTPLGRIIKESIEAGNLVPDDLMIAKMVEILADPRFNKGVILDGFPRTIYQAESLERRRMGLRVVVYLDAPDDVIIDRLSSRLSCPIDERVFNAKTNPPKKPGICDQCGSTLIQRKDDNPESIRKRLEVFRSQTRDLVEFYKDRGILVRVRAVGPPPKILNNVLKLLPQKAGQ